LETECSRPHWAQDHFEATSMHHSFFPGILPLLLIMLLGGPAVAEEAPKQAPAPTQGKSLADPDQQRQADDAMHTEGGKAGRDEPGVHAPLDGDQPVLKDGKLNVPSAPRESNSPRR
jgi:hypothetical protein